MIITTSHHPSSEQLKIANQLAVQLQAEVRPREGMSVKQCCRHWNDSVIMIVGKDGLRLVNGDDQPVFYHPGMAMIRIKRLLEGHSDVMLEIAEIRAGDHILDGTCGLATDALVFGFAAGPDGKVDTCESNPVLAAIVGHGLSCYGEGPPEMIAAMRRIEVHAQDHLRFLEQCKDQSYDVVYFDPMFEQAVTRSSSIAPIRALADHQALQFKTIQEARRVARRSVILKDHSSSSRFKAYGFEAILRKHSDVGYGKIDCRRVREV